MAKVNSEIPWEPMGKALKDYLDGKKDELLIIHSRYGDLKVPVEIYFRSWDAFPELEEYALHLSEGKVLDVGAGSGCHSLALKESGRVPVPIDISLGCVSVMHRQGLQNAECIDFFKLAGQQFDTILMLMNGIGFAADLEGIGKVFRHAGKLLKPGGRFIFDSSDLLKEYPEEKTKARNEYYGIITYTMEYQGTIGEPVNWIYVDQEKMIEIATANGWHCQVIYEDADGQYLAICRPFEL